MLKRLIGFVFVLFLVLIGYAWFTGKSVELKFARPAVAIANATTVVVEAYAPHGVKRFTAAVEQNGQSQQLYEERLRSPQKTRVFNFTAGKKLAPFLKEGTAKLIIKAASNDFRGSTATLAQDVQVVLRPPTIVADGRQHYINQGGSELVTMELGGNWTEAGVRVANYTAGTFPMPEQPAASNHRFSLFPFPWDVSPTVVPFAFARNGAATEVTSSFWVKVFPKRFRESIIQLSDTNMAKVVGELDPEGSGPVLDRFLRLNRELRRVNGQEVYELRKNTEAKILWSGPFIPVKGSRESFFADKRSYMYNGRKVDEQVHLGYDLAQTMNSPVKAANSGRVIYAERLGLYGNCVILDHGYTLQSLYGHLSKILVHVGDRVEKEQQIGISGATGMAFGDHVHFSMMVAGYQVDPKEWWDEHWINDRILSKIGPNASAEPAAPISKETSAQVSSGKRRHGRRR